MNDDLKGLPLWVFPTLSWLISFYFFLAFAFSVGFPPNGSLLRDNSLSVFLWLFFLFFPFFSKVKIGRLLELEREVTKTKQELHDFKADFHNSLAVLSTNINTIVGMTNQVNVNLPSVEEMQHASTEIDQRSTPKAIQEAKNTIQNIFLDTVNTKTALLEIRTQVMRLLRKRLEQSCLGESAKIKAMGFFEPERRFNDFVREYPAYEYLRQPFRYLIKVCDAASHDQKIPDAEANESLTLGAQIIAALKNDFPDNNWTN